VQVTAANPPSTEQGTINLNVKVTGKGFKNGAQAKWFVTGTTNPGGVTVNSTTFVSSTEVTANITVADTAEIANFDIQVLNSDGRGGKGTELFKVIAKGSSGGGGSNCPPMQPPPTSDTKCYAALPGCLDSSFGGVGFVHIDPAGTPSESEVAYAVTVQPDGKILVAATTNAVSTDADVALIRYNVDGTLDTSFGDPDPFNPSLRKGYTQFSIWSHAELLKSMVLQPDGKIVLSLYGDYSSVIIRYNNDGSLDSGFGTTGIVRLGDGAPYYELALQADGKILAGGGGSFSVARLNPNGSLDSSFGVGGIVTANPSGTKRGSAVGWGLAIQRVPALTGEERIVVGGWSANSGEKSAWTLMRFRSNGATDTTFGSNGIVKTAFYGFGDQARKVKIDSSNRIVVAGLIRHSSDNCGDYLMDSAVVRYLQNGSLDGSFSGGKQIVDVYGGKESLYALALQADDKTLLLMTSASSDASVRHFALVRFNIDGSRDSTFGLLGNGVVTTGFYGFGNWGYALAIQPGDGKIIAAGTTYVQNNINQTVVARYLP
jgi:uncharacterized delta-60 repeat protein